MRFRRLISDPMVIEHVESVMARGGDVAVQFGKRIEHLEPERLFGSAWIVRELFEPHRVFILEHCDIRASERDGKNKYLYGGNFA